EGWLYTLVLKTAYDECRKYIGRIKPGDPPPGGGPPQRRGGIRDARILLEETRATPVPRPDHALIRSERQKVVLDLLIRHAVESPKSLESAQLIRMRYFNDWSVAVIATCRYGRPVSARDQEAMEKRIRTRLKSDYKELEIELEQVYGVRQFG